RPHVVEPDIRKPPAAREQIRIPAARRRQHHRLAVVLVRVALEHQRAPVPVTDRAGRAQLVVVVPPRLVAEHLQALVEAVAVEVGGARLLLEVWVLLDHVAAIVNVLLALDRAEVNSEGVDLPPQNVVREHQPDLVHGARVDPGLHEPAAVAEALRDAHGIPIHAHPQTASRLEFAVDREIDDGWTLDLGDGHTIEAVYTPGHAPGHLLVWDRKTGIAHAGDLVAGQGTILIDVRDGGDMAVYLDSLRRMAARVRSDPGGSVRFVPAHGPVLDDPAAVLDHYVAHRLAREDKVRRAVVEQGHRTFLGILASVYADTPKRMWPIAGLSLEAHLRKLVGDGELIREGLGARPA